MSAFTAMMNLLHLLRSWWHFSHSYGDIHYFAFRHGTAFQDTLICFKQKIALKYLGQSRKFRGVKYNDHFTRLLSPLNIPKFSKC